MAKYKAKDSYKSAKNKHFGVHKVKMLEKGLSIEITEFDKLPESIKGHLQLEGAKTKTKVSKVVPKKKTEKEINNGSSN